MSGWNAVALPSKNHTAPAGALRAYALRAYALHTCVLWRVRMDTQVEAR